jgi:lipoprotein-anchoring transpeptidase ErfK/SrfK
MQLIKVLFFITFVLSAFVSLSAVYVLGLDRSIEIAQYAYKHSVAKVIQPAKTAQRTPPAMTIEEAFDAIDKEMLSLLDELETRNKAIDFNAIDVLPSPIAIVELPKLTDTLALFFDKSILTPPTIKLPLKTTKPNTIIAYKKPKQKDVPLGNKVHIKVNLSTQRMSVYGGNKLLYHWKVSTGRKGYSTPTGQYEPKYLTKMHYSHKYHNSPMPYSIFFRGGYACHGTTSEWRLGQRASHGCVRLKTSNAKTLFHLVQNAGKERSTIDIKY